MHVTLSDGTTQDFVYPAEVWSRNTEAKHVTRIELDPAHLLIDIDRGNNVWSASGPTT